MRALAGFTCLAALGLAMPHSAIAQGCTAAIAHAVDRIAGTRAALRALPNGDLDPMLPKTAQRSIVRMKAAVSVYVEAQMACLDSDAEAGAITQALNRPLEPLQCTGDCPTEPYGTAPTFEARRWNGSLVGIVARIGIMCGSDAMLFVYAYDRGQWRESLRWHSAPYADVSGAFEAFDYRISPRDETGRWYVLASSIAPWCSSTWSSIRYAALRPSGDVARPKILLSASDEIYWGTEDFGKLVAEPREFDVRFHAGSIDMGVHNRVWIRHFALDGDKVRRTAPVALSPRDFVDEWIVSPWALAARWSAAERRPALARLHAQLHDAKNTSFELAAIHACAGAMPRYEVDLSSDRDEDDWFFSVRGGQDFMLTDIRRKADPACGGDDLRVSMSTRN
ncbi:MAG TPA: hypothetical protein VFB32_09220 [Rudaea sp.]|nr:hypothetical protein [Rudaea sp.]